MEYAISQPGVLLHYLRLVLWPYPLCFDHGWLPVQTMAQAALPALAISVLFAATLYAVWCRSWLGMVGATFFLVLAPTSSILPIADLAVEHRMYLALAPLVAALVVSGYCLCVTCSGRSSMVGAMVLVGVAVVLGGLTVRRNRDYSSPVQLWYSVVRTAPHHYRGHNNLAGELCQPYQLTRDLPYEQQLRLAERHYRSALALRPGIAEGNANLGRALGFQKKWDEAIPEFERAIALKPDYAEAHGDLGRALAAKGRRDEAIHSLRRALELAPKSAVTHSNLGAILATNGDLPQAIEHFQRAVQLQPDHADWHRNLALALRKTGRHLEARKHLAEAERLMRTSRKP
jgi:tetratricopeptide (TPR) repeat protein